VLLVFSKGSDAFARGWNRFLQAYLVLFGVCRLVTQQQCIELERIIVARSLKSCLRVFVVVVDVETTQRKNRGVQSGVSIRSLAMTAVSDWFCYNYPLS